MATIVLQAAGAFLGGALGPIGSALGAAAGAMAGYTLDRMLIEGGRRFEGPRLGEMRPFQAEEGVPIARVYGTMRVGGNMIWATRFEETSTTQRQGGKGGGPRVTTYSYFANVAFSLCEGEIAGVRRIWADGRELDLDETTVRVYPGSDTQPVDPLIAAKQGIGNAPAYRGIAYVVFERFPLASYGNRVPQFQFEVMRPVGRLNGEIRSVALLPGATEYGLLPRPVTLTTAPGVSRPVNRHVLHGPTDLVASLDELQALCPDLEEVAIILTWFGNDLRAGECLIRPGVTHSEPAGYSEPWKVSGVVREEAVVVSYIDGGAAYGGTPSDQSVIECIAEIRSRGLRVALYPFMMMDVPPDNELPNPYGGTGQPPFPWRGRITCHPGPGEDGTADKSAAARLQVAAFAGSAVPGDFSVVAGAVVFAGDAADWGYRRLVLHYARLAALAGGVDTFLIGSELRGLSTLRDGSNAFPFVEVLCGLAGEVRAILGAGTAITYGADWTEYFGHQPPDGSGDVFFHLDPLWAHPAVTAVGIDNYMPLSDWRDADLAGGNSDDFLCIYDNAGLRGQVAAGEGFDWYYDGTARAGRQRAPITDGAYGKDWVFRYKDIVSWWQNEHHDRIGGVEVSEPTVWRPRSKPVWFTELGCPAVDKGPNQPNVFPDPKSSESAAPYFSLGARSDEAQARYLLAHFDHWNPASPHFDDAANPISPVYGGRMIDTSRICIWSWDARPFPAFPVQSHVWSDGGNWHAGHWLNGRLSAVLGSDLVAAILRDHDLPPADVELVGGSMIGYVSEAPTTARAALEPFAGLFGVAIRDESGKLVFAAETGPAIAPLPIEDLVVDGGEPTFERIRVPDSQLPDAVELSFIDLFQDYQPAVARHARPGARNGSAERLSFPGSLYTDVALQLLSDWLERRHVGRDSIGFAVPAASVDVTPGALVSLASDTAGYEYLVMEVEQGLSRRASARRVSRGVAAPWLPERSPVALRPSLPAGAPHALLLDLPLMPDGADFQHQFRVAAFADPWQRQAVYCSPEETGFVHVGTVESRATTGELVAGMGGGPRGRVDRIGAMTVRLYGGELSSVSRAHLLNGANAAAVLTDGGAWEVLQFGAAEEIGPSVWQLRHLLRGQLGTTDAMAAGASAGAPFVLLDSAVVRAGLMPEQAGLILNWRVGPATRDPGSSSYARFGQAGGVRARLPFAPVHLRMTLRPDGGADLSWIRCGRVDADSWLAEEIALGEESERYRITIATAGGTVKRTAETASPHWAYAAGAIAADFPERPAIMQMTVQQLSAAVGAGIPASRLFNLT